MTRSHVFHLVATVLCIAAMFGLNRYVQPRFDTHYAESEYTQKHGTLSFSRNGAELEVGLMTIHVVSQDIVRLGRTYPMHELALRGVAPSDQKAGVELYVDLSGVRGGDASSLQLVELPLMRAGRLGSRPSFILFENGPRRIVTGNLRLTELTEAEGGGYHTAGRIEMQVEGEHGIEMITGRVEGMITWDPVTAA